MLVPEGHKDRGRNKESLSLRGTGTNRRTDSEIPASRTRETEKNRELNQSHESQTAEPREIWAREVWLGSHDIKQRERPQASRL